MLAIGQSLVSTFEALKPFGKPKEVHLISIIGSKKGINYVEEHFNKNTRLWIGTID